MTTPHPIDPAERVPAPQICFEPATLRPRHDGWTAERQIRFIEVLAASKCVDAACRAVGMSDTSAYELRQRPCGAAFRKAWEIALEVQLDAVEQGAIERSVHGVARPIFYKGEKVGEYRHFDERLTMFMLSHRRPVRYGKWIDQAAPTERTEDERRYALADALTKIAFTAPTELGNPVEDWSDREDDEENGATEQ